MTAFPLTLFLAVVFGEVGNLRNFPYLRDPAFLIAFAICTFMGPLITYSTLLCTTINSPLTTSITGNVKDIALTFLGGLLFSDFKATVSNIIGIGLSFIGAGAYSWMSIMDSNSVGKGGAGVNSTTPKLLNDLEKSEEGSSLLVRVGESSSSFMKPPGPIVRGRKSQEDSLAVGGLVSSSPAQAEVSPTIIVDGRRSSLSIRTKGI